MHLSGISHGNSSRIPPGAGDGGVGGRGASDGFTDFPQLLFKQHSLSHHSGSRCKVFECGVCLCAHLLSEGAACLEIGHFDVSIFILVFLTFF